MNDIKSQFHPSSTANVLVIDPVVRPNTWTANTEIDLGGGLYGYRATGNMPEITANSSVSFTIANVVTSRFVSCGGNINYTLGGSSRHYPAFVCRYGTDNALQINSSILDTSTDVKMLITCGANASTTTSNTYDVWFTYTK